MITPDYRVVSCGVPMAHDSHLFDYMANGVCWTAQCLGEEAKRPKELRCSNGHVLKYHTRPCAAGCEYPGPDYYTSPETH